MSVNPVSSPEERRFRIEAHTARDCNVPFNSNPRSTYQSEYFVPSSAVPVDFEYTSKTFLPPQLVESGSS